MQSPNTRQKKRHHFVPIAYLNRFTGQDGKIYAYRSENPTVPLHQKPNAIGFEGYYYSQTRPDGTIDNNSLEDLFSQVEATWTPIMEKIERRQDVTSDFDAIVEFMALQRVRGPAARDLVETDLAGRLMATLRQMDAKGLLPPKPEGFEDILDHAVFSIDPQKSLEAMGLMAQGVGAIISRLGFQIVHIDELNDSSFITSDNPVVFFDPSIPEDRLVPYQRTPPFGLLELLFPIGSRTLLRGHSDLRGEFQQRGLRHVRLTSRQEVKRINRLVAKFGYRLIFSADKSHAPLIAKYGKTGPRERNTCFPIESGTGSLTTSEFGPRPAKPKLPPDEIPREHA